MAVNRWKHLISDTRKHILSGISSLEKRPCRHGRLGSILPDSTRGLACPRRRSTSANPVTRLHRTYKANPCIFRMSRFAATCLGRCAATDRDFPLARIQTYTQTQVKKLNKKQRRMKRNIATVNVKTRIVVKMCQMWFTDSCGKCD